MKPVKALLAGTFGSGFVLARTKYLRDERFHYADINGFSTYELTFGSEASIPVGNAAIGNPHLRPVDDPLLPFFLGFSLDTRHVGSRTGFGHAIRLRTVRFRFASRSH